MPSSSPLLPVSSGRAARPSPRVARIVAAVAVAGAAVVVLATLALQRVPRPADLAQVPAGINDKFLHAISGGEQGANFVQRLEDVWFVEKHNGRADLAGDSTELAAGMMIAGFPEDMHAAIDVKVNPCEDFYEFACGKWDYDNRNAIPVRSQIFSVPAVTHTDA
jgi:hypothetical protein